MEESLQARGVEAMRIGVVIVNHDRRELLSECLASLVAGGEHPLVVVVDNGSTDGSPEVASSACPGAQVLVLPHNTGFCHANNVGIQRALALGCDAVLVLNNDTRVAPGSLAALAAALDRGQRVGMAAPRVVLAGDGRTLDAIGMRITPDGLGKLEGNGRSSDEATAAGETFCPYGAAAFYQREMLHDVAPDGEWFDEDFHLYCEELDLGWRARLRGWKCVHVPAAVVHHHRGGTSGQYSELLAYFTSRNSVFNILKNYPGWYAPWAVLLSLLRPLVLAVGLLARRGPAQEFRQRTPAHRLALVHLRGWRDAVWRARSMLRKRREVQGRREVTSAEVRRWFRELGEPYLRALLG